MARIGDKTTACRVLMGTSEGLGPHARGRRKLNIIVITGQWESACAGLIWLRTETCSGI